VKSYISPDPICFHIEKPISEFSKNFFIPGQAPLHMPPVKPFRDLNLSVPSHLKPGDAIPLIYVRGGIIIADLVPWGFKDKGTEETLYFRECTRDTIGYPSLCPTSYVDLMTDRNFDGEKSIVRVRNRNQSLYVGCVYRQHSSAKAESVVPLMRPACKELVRYMERQPLFISIAPFPIQKNFDFLHRRDRGRLQRPYDSYPRDAASFTSDPANISVELIPA